MAEPATTRTHEPDVPRLRPLTLGGAAILGTVVVAIVVAFLVVRGFAPPHIAPGVPGRIAGGEPHLQATPERDFPAFHRDKQQLLHEYAWVDRAHGIVRIPIERAMTLLVEEQAQRKRAP